MSEEQSVISQGRSSQNNKRTVHKNKFIRKMRQIMPEHSMRTMIRQPNELDKRQRNKRSAKQSRDRKKLYIQMLEQKQKELQKQLQGRRRELIETQNYLQRVVDQNQAMSSFAASRHQMIKQLEILVQASQRGEDKDEDINRVVDSLKWKIGATGQERITTINQYFKQIVHLSLPALHRYMMWSAATGKHLFAPEGNIDSEEWFVQIQSSLRLSQGQLQEIRTKQEFLKEQKHLIQELISSLKTVKTDIQQKSIELEDMVDGIRGMFTPLQCALFILFIEKNKYRKQISLCDAMLNDQLNDQ